MDIEPTWTPAGRAAANGFGIDFAEAVAVVYKPTAGVWVGDGERRVMLLGGTPGRVIVVTLDRLHRNVTIFEITDVRPATEAEYDAWEKRQQ